MVDFEKRTLKQLFEIAVENYSDEDGFGFVDEKIFTFQEIKETVYRLSQALSESGIKKGDRVAILSENSPQWAMAYFSIITMGAISVPILPDFHKSEINHILRISGAKLLFLSSKLAHKIADANIKNVEWVVALDDGDIINDGYDIKTLTKFIEKRTPAANSNQVEEDDIAEILYTSGTTGHSKGVMLSHKNITSNAISAIKMIGINKSDRLLSILPLPHVYEGTCGFIAPFSQGAKIYYIKGLPTAQVLLPAVQKIKPTIILSVPLIMDKIYKKKVLGEINSKSVSRSLYKIKPVQRLIHKVAGKKLYEAFGGRLKFMVFGGAATPLEVEIFLTEGNFPYITGYGLTESSPILTVSPLEKVKHQSCGIKVPEVDIRIDDTDPKTGIGEIVATGPNIMQGYYKNDKATRNAFTKDGWLKTGDRGYIDEEGYLFIKGRSKNIIVGPSGENIYPEEIEFHISQSQFVSECLVYELDGKIISRVFLDYEKIDTEFNTNDMDESKSSKLIKDLLEKIRKDVNSRVANYSRVHRMIEQPEEFEKTPTKKIKRYLYVSRDVND